jgi:hypothetical protein
MFFSRALCLSNRQGSGLGCLPGLLSAGRALAAAILHKCRPERKRRKAICFQQCSTFICKCTYLPSSRKHDSARLFPITTFSKCICANCSNFGILPRPPQAHYRFHYFTILSLYSLYFFAINTYSFQRISDLFSSSMVILPALTAVLIVVVYVRLTVHDVTGGGGGGENTVAIFNYKRNSVYRLSLTLWWPRLLLCGLIR